jgi:hypothetical protein
MAQRLPFPKRATREELNLERLLRELGLSEKEVYHTFNIQRQFLLRDKVTKEVENLRAQDLPSKPEG